MRLSSFLFAGVLTAGSSIVLSEAILSSDPSTEEIEKLRRNLALEPEKTKEAEQEAVKKCEQESLQERIECLQKRIKQLKKKQQQALAQH
jgi:hypothetical protein